jgi:UDP-glucose 4-epimerase
MALYLVTGGCGFIGSHLVEELLAHGHQVRIVDNLSTGKMSNLPLDRAAERCEVVVGDVTREDVVDQCFQGVDFCFHLAAIASVQLSNEDWAGTHRANLTASINVFNAARNNQVPVVYASSAAVYGDNAETPLKESASLRPLTAYGADKLGSELHARVASLVHSVPTTGLRFFNVYGPRQDASSPYSGVISIFTSKITSRQALFIYGDGDQVRDFIYVGDVVKYLLAAMQNISVTPTVYNVCTGRCTTINQLARTIMSVSGQRVSIQYQTSRKGDIRVSVGAPHLAERRFKLRAQESLASGLKKLMDFDDQTRSAAGDTAGIPASQSSCALRLS